MLIGKDCIKADTAKSVTKYGGNMKNVKEVEKMNKIADANGCFFWTGEEGKNEEGKPGALRKNIYILKNNSPEYVRDALYNAHGGSFPRDFIYSTIAELLQSLTESNTTEDNTTAIADTIQEIEADIYTADLTSWLNEHNGNVDYITQALEEHGQFKDGFALLSTAQYIAKTDICNLFINKLLN